MVQRKRKLKRSVVNFFSFSVDNIYYTEIVNLWFHSVEHLRLDF